MTRRQLLIAGLSPRQVDYLLASGRLVAVHRGVARVAAFAIGDLGVAAAACLAAGPGAVVAGWLAARLHGAEIVRYTRDEVRVPEVLAAVTRPRRRPDLVLLPHDGGDHVVIADVRVQPLMDALRMLLRGSDRLRAVWACESAIRRRLVEPAALAEQRLPASRRSWVAMVEPRSESPLETWIRLVAADAELPSFEPQLPVSAEGRQYYLDLALPDRRIAVEGDGKAAHPDDPKNAAVWRDRGRHQALRRAGWRIVRVTWWDMLVRRDWVVAEIRREIAAVV